MFRSTLQVKEDTPLRKVCAALPGAVMAYELFQGRTRLMAGDRVLVLDGFVPYIIGCSQCDSVGILPQAT